MPNLEVEDYVLFGGLAEDSRPRGSLSDGSGGRLSRGGGGPRVYRSSAVKTRWSEQQKMTIN